MKKYSAYMSDVEHFISPYHFEAKPLEVFSEKLYDVGFKIFHIEIRDQIFVFDDVELLKCKFCNLALGKGLFCAEQKFFSFISLGVDSVKAVNPFSGRMPEALQDDFLDDYVMKVDEMHLIQSNERSFRQSVITPYKLMIVIANK